MEIESYVTGFVDGEGCFSVSFSMRKKMRFGIEVRPSFSVSQHKRNKEVVFLLQKFFGCGGVRFSRKDQNYKYEVRSIKDLITKVIPHFEKWHLQTSKRADYEAFKLICELIYANQHQSKEGLYKIVELSKRVNITGNKKFNRDDLLKLIAG